MKVIKPWTGSVVSTHCGLGCRDIKNIEHSMPASPCLDGKITLFDLVLRLKAPLTPEAVGGGTVVGLVAQTRKKEAESVWFKGTRGSGR